MKHLLFEDNGDFRAGTVLAETGGSMQVELASGKRAKVKGAHVVLRFDSPAPDELLPAARQLAESIDLDFLWECAPQDEFGFAELADEYYGHRSSPVEAAGLLLRLHGAPVYFHRKGRGRFRPAPAETLRLALAAVERRRQQEQQIEQMAAEMAEGRLPDEIRQQAAQLLVRPDKNGVAWKAFERALALAQQSPERLLLALGAFASPRELHMARFAAEFFPHGFGWAGPGEAAASFDAETEAELQALPLSDAQPFSVDDSTTTEIDDCLSVQTLPDGRHRIGIHIAAPGLAIRSGDALDALARDRMSTIYMPGDKITMLPEALIAAFSLDEGRVVPALSLYVDLDADGSRIAARFSRAERIRVASNLRHDLLDVAVDEAALSAAEAPSFAHGAELQVLWRLTLALCAERERVRGKPEPRFKSDFNFYIDRDGDEERVRIVNRRRDAPLDRIVAEMMILANSEWGRMLADHEAPGIYRSQQAARVRMTTHPLPHQGLGVPQYMWTTSPLRRYLDLVNQRQLLAVLAGSKPPFGHNDAELFSIMSAFEAKYSAYLDFQHRMERYWCLRWLCQEGRRRIDAVIVREDLVRLVEVPLYFRLAGLPMLAPGRQIVVDVLGTDEVDLSIEARFVEVGSTALAADDLEEGDDALAEQAA
ncbi:MAG: RNB domain-containing ribonuclease [Burkholderiaceae bacterium]